jgi:hypothetical protein
MESSSGEQVLLGAIEIAGYQHANVSFGMEPGAPRLVLPPVPRHLASVAIGFVAFGYLAADLPDFVGYAR